MDKITEEPTEAQEEIKPEAKEPVVVEFEYKIVQRGNRFMAMKRKNGSDWQPLLYDYTLPTSAIGVVETEMVNDIYQRGRR